MVCSVADFRTRLPEFVDDTEYPDARVQLFLDDSANCHIGTNEPRWCGKYDVVQCYLAAHLLTLGTNTEAGATGSTTGTITNKSAGGVSVTRAANTKVRSDSDEFYLSTAYGQQFLVLRSMCFVGAMAVNCV